MIKILKKNINRESITPAADNKMTPVRPVWSPSPCTRCNLMTETTHKHGAIHKDTTRGGTAKFVEGLNLMWIHF